MRLRYITYIIALLLIQTGCSERLETVTLPGTETDVYLAVTAQLMRSADALTKAAYIDPSTQESVEVKDLWVLQFDGTAAGAKMIKACYYPDYSPSTKVRLITSTLANTLLLVANTGDPAAELSRCRTLAEAETTGKTVIQDTGAHGGQTAGKWNVIMNGKTTVTVTDGMAPISVSLVRNAVRIDVSITNATGTLSNPVTINSVTVCSGVSKMFYYTDYTLPDIYPASVTETKPYAYPATDWADGTGTGDTRQFTFYLPANKRGIITNVDASRKAALAPHNASCLLVLATDSESRRVAYRFYLGADMTQDYNLLPGYRYQYNLTINGVGDALADSRVEDLNMLDYTQSPLANSYMIQPPFVEGVWKSVRIPVRRVYDFWNATDGYEKVPANSLDVNSYGWQAEIIRSTVQLTDDVNFKWIKRTGTDYTDYFEFAIPAGLEGNFVIGVHRFTDQGCTILDDVFLWSWHMWVTDYNPDATLPYLTPEVDAEGNESRYVYDVQGGEVNRYSGNLWKTGGKLDGRFMMDRNLGQLSVTQLNLAGLLYYQFGRKDPFPYYMVHNSPWKGAAMYNRYDETNGAYPSKHYNQLSESNLLTDLVRYSVYHPDTYIMAYSEGWCLGDDDADGIHYATRTNWYDTKKTDDEKSIFDPCPPGWRLPPNGSLAKPAGTTSKVINLIDNFTLPDGKVIRFMRSGYITWGWNYSNNGVSSATTVAFNSANENVWSYKKGNNYQGKPFGYFALSGSDAPAYAYPVRCVSCTEP